MPSLSAAKNFNAGYCPSYFPVAIFVGGTSGVGKCMSQAFAALTKGRAHIIIVGRNRAAAESIIATFPKPTGPDNEGWKHEFISCDVSLMKNIHETCAALRTQLKKVNFLVHSAGYGSLSGYQPTAEGIDEKLALRYYSRFAFFNDLLPLLRNAKEFGEDAKAMSVLGAGFNLSIDLDNLGLKENFSGYSAMRATPTYNDIAVYVGLLFLLQITPMSTS